MIRAALLALTLGLGGTVSAATAQTSTPAGGEVIAAIRVPAEIEPPACDCARQRAKRRSTLSGETETLERSLRQNVRGREHTPLPLADFDPPSESVSHSTQERPGASH